MRRLTLCLPLCLAGASATYSAEGPTFGLGEGRREEGSVGVLTRLERFGFQM